MNDFDYYFGKMMSFYKVGTIKDLASKIDALPSTVSNWNQRKSISSLQRITRELGIYDDIFEANVSINQNNINGQSTGIDLSSGNIKLNTATQDSKSSLDFLNDWDQLHLDILKAVHTKFKNKKEDLLKKLLEILA